MCYIAGPFRGPDSWTREQHIRRAETLALDAWREGAAVICPHTNTRFFDGAADDDVWLKGDLALLACADVLLMTDDWTRSEGACREHEFARDRGIPIVYSIDELRAWLALTA